VSEARARAAALDTVRRLEPSAEARDLRQLWWAEGGEARLAWGVAVRSGALPPSTYDIVVDAHSGQVLAVRKTSATAEAIVYDPSPTLAMAERIDLQMPDLTGPYADARSCIEVSGACAAWERQAVPDEAGDYLFRPYEAEPVDPFAEVQAVVHADRMLAWLDERFGLQLPYGPITTYVNFPTANAFFGDFDDDDTPDISFGHDPVSGTDLGYDADVVYHELGHAVVDLLAPDLPYIQADELGMSWVSGSVNEGAADVFAMVLTGDPQVGEHAGAAFGASAVRDLTEPRHCPDHLRGQVHHDGEILGSTLWRLQQHPDIGADAVAEILVGAIPLWGPDVSWALVAESLSLSAQDLHDAGALSDIGMATVSLELSQSGMAGCERIVDMGDGDQRTFYVVGVGAGEPLDRVPANLQVRVEGHERLVVEELELAGPSGLSWSVFGRRGAPVEHGVIELSGLALAMPEVYDWVVDADDDGQVVLGGDDAPLGDEPVYLTFTGRNTGSLAPLAVEVGRLQVAFDSKSAASVDRVEPASVSYAGEPAPTTRVDGGCGCSAGPRSGSAVWLGLLVVVAARRERYTARR